MKNYNYTYLYCRMQPNKLSHQNLVFKTIKGPSKKMLTPLQPYSQEKVQKKAIPIFSKVRSSTSCECSNQIFSSIQRKHSFRNQDISISQEDFIPSQARKFNDMVKKKHKLLKIKHKIQNDSNFIPNICQIKQSVKQSEANFLRKINKKINADGHGDLLQHLKRDFHIKSHNYLKDLNLRCKKNRRYLKREDSTNEDQYITIHYRLQKNQIYG